MIRRRGLAACAGEGDWDPSCLACPELAEAELFQCAAEVSCPVRDYACDALPCEPLAGDMLCGLDALRSGSFESIVVTTPGVADPTGTDLWLFRAEADGQVVVQVVRDEHPIYIESPRRCMLREDAFFTACLEGSTESVCFEPSEWTASCDLSTEPSC